MLTVLRMRFRMSKSRVRKLRKLPGFQLVDPSLIVPKMPGQKLPTDEFGFELPQSPTVTHKEVADRLMKVLYKNDMRKDYLHHMNSDLHADLGLDWKDMNDLLASLEMEFDLDFVQTYNFIQFRKVRDLHAHICQQFCIPASDGRTIRQRKADAKREKEEEQMKRLTTATVEVPKAIETGKLELQEPEMTPQQPRLELTNQWMAVEEKMKKRRKTKAEKYSRHEAEK